MRNKESANPADINIVKTSASLLCFLSGSSGGMAISADHCNVEYPSFIASNNEATPLKIGFFQNLDFSVTEKNDFRLIRICPPGSLTAIATAPGTRIITPSITACPPTRIEGFIMHSVLNETLIKRDVLEQ